MHPAVFPVEIPRRLIKLYTLPGETVVDPFMGRGTTGVACAELGRRFVGIEADRRFFERASNCIRNAMTVEHSRLPLWPATKVIQQKLIP